MFNNLIESKAKRQGGASYTAVSTMLVASLIASAAYATQQVHQLNEKVKQEDVKFVDVKKEEPPPPKEEPPPPPPDQPVVNPPPKGFQTLTAPIKIPDVIPDIDLSKKATDEADFSGKGVQGGVAKGVVGGSGPVNDNQALFEFQVDKPAQVEALYKKALSLGATDEGPPGDRGDNYYGAYFRDLDGNKLNFHCWT